MYLVLRHPVQERHQGHRQVSPCFGMRVLEPQAVEPDRDRVHLAVWAYLVRLQVLVRLLQLQESRVVSVPEPADRQVVDPVHRVLLVRLVRLVLPGSVQLRLVELHPDFAEPDWFRYLYLFQ